MGEKDQFLSCNQLTKIYNKGKTKALDSVSFSIPSRGIFVLIGRNGSGKTTLVRILATELEPTSGSAIINGMDVIKNAGLLREKIAIVPQEARSIPWMTPIQTAQSYLMWRGFGYNEARQRAAESLSKLGLSEYSHMLNRRLSGGMRRKVLVATVLSSEAEIIFLDEPTTGLDPISRKDLWTVLREIGKEHFTFLTTHYLEEAEQLANEIGILEHGRIIRIGTLDQLRQSVDYNYSLNISPGLSYSALPKVERGESVTGPDGSIKILTVEEEAFRISRELSKGGFRFTINPISLEDIFSFLVSKEGGMGTDARKELANEEE